MKIKTQKPYHPTKDEITLQLERMESSPDFKATPQQIALLKYVVARTQEGNADGIKGYTVATEVFGRGADFDQSIDPIVSIQASRLRQALSRYYETSGINDPLKIDIPLGTYVPTFNEQISSEQHVTAETAKSVCDMAAWPTVLVRPMTILSGNSEDDYLAIGLTAELAHALSHYREIRVLEGFHRDQNTSSPEIVYNFIIDGHVRRDSSGVRVTIRLRDAEKGVRIWSGKYRENLEAAKMISFQEEVAAKVAVSMAGGNAVIPRHLSGQSKNKPATELTTYEAMLRYWESTTLQTAQTMTRAIGALEKVVAREPDCGQTWSMLASLYADNYGLELIDIPTPLEKAAAFAQKGLGLDPTNRRARMTMAYVRLLENRLEEARSEAETAYHQYPNSLMILDGIGGVMALAGGWEEGITWIKKAIELNPYHRPWVRQVLCLNCFRLGNYEKAYQETLKFTLPESLWDQILKASACGHLGKIEEGQTHVGALLGLKPDFEQRSRDLIGKYVKFEDISQRIIEGLTILGMKI